MKRITSVLLVLLSLVMIIPMMVIGAGASSAYQTYTYSLSGTALYSPDAYSAELSMNYLDMGLDKDFNNPNDLVTDDEGRLYIADTGNNRIVVLNRYYEYQFSITTFINEQGNNDALQGPRGVFVIDDSIWVCDTDKNRLVEFDRKGNFKQILDAPESQLFDSDATYKPVAMAIDQYGRIYVVSSSTYQGVIVMDSKGEFVNFAGAQAVTISAWEKILSLFRTDEQKALTAGKVSVEYNNIDINEEGFIYVTTAAIEKSSVEGAIRGKSKEGTYMPVKLLNPAGDEIMRRNGFWPPAGEIDIFSGVIDSPFSGPSVITDVAAGPAKTWTIIDSQRNKIYTYDFNGNLLFAFGDSGTMLGSITSIRALTYQDDTMLVLDAGNNSINVYERTEYGDMLIEAITAENSLDYVYAIECWEKVLQRNSNFDAAYVGIGNSLYRDANYEEAMKQYEYAYDTENWSNAYKEVRKIWMADWLIPLVLVLVLLIIAVVKFFGWAAKVNKRVSTDGQHRKKFWQELVYGCYVIFHPFDGFYDLKHERRGSVRGAIVFLTLTVLAFYYQTVGTGYVMQPTPVVSSIWSQLISVLVPIFLFILANWCLTTLFEGEGSFKDIFIATCYSLLPLPMLIIPATIASNFVTTTEASIVSMIVTIAFIWAGLLIFCGTMITHDYSIFKNLITILGTIVAMACIVFIALLFSMLLSKLVSLVTNIITEIQYRV